ncbi:MAG: AAA family ATPase [Bryobacteraceae bacterium]
MNTATPKPNGEACALGDVELEDIFVGSLMAHGLKSYELIAAIVDRSTFITDRNRIIFGAIQILAAEGEFGLSTVADRLYTTGEVARIGGFGTLNDIHGKALGPDLVAFAQTLAKKARQRQALALVEKISRTIEVGDLLSTTDIEALHELVSPQVGGGLPIEALPAVGATQEAVSYIIDPELPLGALVGFTGNSGCGKSTVVTAMIRVANAAGIPALVLDRENPRAVVYDRMNRLGLIDGPLVRWAGGWLEEVPGPDSSIVREWVRRCEPKPLVVVDSLVAFMGGDENSATEMRAFMNHLRRLADMGATVALIHHDGKSESSVDYRGSSDFKAALDQAFHVTNNGADGRLDRLRLRPFKSRYGLARDVLYLYADGRMVKDDRAEAPVITLAEQMASTLRSNPGATQRTLDKLILKAGINRARARQWLNDGVLSGLVRREKGAKKSFHYYLKMGDEE